MCGDQEGVSSVSLVELQLVVLVELFDGGLFSWLSGARGIGSIVLRF